MFRTAEKEVAEKKLLPLYAAAVPQSQELINGSIVCLGRWWRVRLNSALQDTRRHKVWGNGVGGVRRCSV